MSFPWRPWRAPARATATRRPRARAALVGVALGGVALGGTALAGCGASSGSTSQPDRAVLHVVASNFALAELVHGVGGARVSVTDLAARAPDDRTVVPSAAQVTALHSAQLVVEVGGGWQPHVEADAGRGPRVLALGRQGKATGSQVWLDPVSMEAAGQALASRLIAVDPAGAGAYRNGVRDFNDNLSSVSVDYQSSLGDCEYNSLFTPDAAFATVASRYGLKLYSLPGGGATAALNIALSVASRQSFHGVFLEPPLASPQIRAFAARGKASVGQLDTMDGPPIRSEPASSTYLDRLEANLNYLSGALYCQNGDGP